MRRLVRGDDAGLRGAAANALLDVNPEASRHELERLRRTDPELAKRIEMRERMRAIGGYFD